MAILFVVGMRMVAKEVWRGYDEWDKDKLPWHECAFDLPDSTGKVVYLIRKAHPLQPEYDRKLRLEIPNQSPVTIDLMPDTGGANRNINFYIHKSTLGDNANIPLLRIEDKAGGVYYYDLKNCRLLKEEDIAELGSGRYLGQVYDQSGPTKFVPAQDNAESPPASQHDDVPFLWSPPLTVTAPPF
jgi:hypothetical protein